MGLFDFFKMADINEGVETFRKTDGAVLLDVRTVEEYAQGHIPKSVNLPLSEIGNIAHIAEDKATPIFVHCLSGARSSQAEGALKYMGYTAVQNIGGINSYRGEIERGSK